jgi:hypothetical protein
MDAMLSLFWLVVAAESVSRPLSRPALWKLCGWQDIDPQVHGALAQQLGA